MSMPEKIILAFDHPLLGTKNIRVRQEKTLRPPCLFSDRREQTHFIIILAPGDLVAQLLEEEE